MKSQTEEANESSGGQAPKKSDWLTLTQVSQELQTSQTTLRRLIERREIPASRIGVCLRIRRSDVDAYMERNTWTAPLLRKRTARPGAGRRKRPDVRPVPEPARADRQTRTQ